MWTLCLCSGVLWVVCFEFKKSFVSSRDQFREIHARKQIDDWDIWLHFWSLMAGSFEDSPVPLPLMPTSGQDNNKAPSLVPATDSNHTSAQEPSPRPHTYPQSKTQARFLSLLPLRLLLPSSPQRPHLCESQIFPYPPWVLAFQTNFRWEFPLLWQGEHNCYLLS